MTVFAPLLKMEAEIEVLTTKISEMPENLNELIEKQAELNDRFIADGGLTCRNRAKAHSSASALRRSRSMLLSVF